MKVGDLVRYRVLEHRMGLIVAEESRGFSSTRLFRISWNNSSEQFQLVGPEWEHNLEIVSESR